MVTDSQVGPGQEPSGYKETERNLKGVCVCVCDLKAVPRHSVDCSNVVPQQIPSLLRGGATLQLFSGAACHRMTLTTFCSWAWPSSPYSDSLSTATSSFCPRCRACHQWERRDTFGEEKIQTLSIYCPCPQARVPPERYGSVAHVADSEGHVQKSPHPT